MGRKRGDDAGARRRVSQSDVARLAGVSTGIVSSVINSRDYGSIRVSAPTRERVWAAVRELGYVPNLAARSLARGSNRLIGVFTYLPLFPLESRDFYHDFLVGIEEQAEQEGYNMLLVTGAKNERRERSVYAGGVNNLQLADGSVLLGSGEVAEELARLTAEKYPFVFIGQREPAGLDLSYVAADYRGGTAAIMQELYRLGHRRIGMVQHGGSVEPVPGRRAGFLTGRTELGLAEQDTPLLSLAPDRVDEPGIEVVRTADDLVETAQRRELTALVVEASADAAAVRAAAARRGWSVPQDLSVVGLGVSPVHPASSDLAELIIPRREMGQESVRILLALLGGGVDVPIRTTLACPLEHGRTLGTAPTASRHLA